MFIHWEELLWFSILQSNQKKGPCGSNLRMVILRHHYSWVSDSQDYFHWRMKCTKCNLGQILFPCMTPNSAIIHSGPSFFFSGFWRQLRGSGSCWNREERGKAVKLKSCNWMSECSIYSPWKTECRRCSITKNYKKTQGHITKVTEHVGSSWVPSHIKIHPVPKQACRCLPVKEIKLPSKEHFWKMRYIFLVTIFFPQLQSLEIFK